MFLNLAPFPRLWLCKLDIKNRRVGLFGAKLRVTSRSRAQDDDDDDDVNDDSDDERGLSEV